MFNISQSAIDQVITDMQTGASDDFVASFFANRPDWQDKDDSASVQTDKQEEKAEK